MAVRTFESISTLAMPRALETSPAPIFSPEKLITWSKFDLPRPRIEPSPERAISRRASAEISTFSAWAMKVQAVEYFLQRDRAELELLTA